MWQLQKVGAGIGLIILFELCKVYLRTHQHEAYFYYFSFNLLSCYQVLILAFCVVTLFFETIFLRKLSRKRRIVISTSLFLFLVISGEVVCTYLLYHPHNIPPRAFQVFRTYYENYDCKLIQYEPQATEFDKKLFYKLKNRRRFRYENKEFSNIFNTNSSGFRDVESALAAPSVICLGDSYTLGWGVEQTDTYPAVIESLTGLNTLNAGMSSYGTARESAVLSSLDTSNVTFIIWQYCSNDDEENVSFIDNKYRSSEGSIFYFEKNVQLQKWSTTYFPGKHFLTLFKMFFSPRKKNPTTAGSQGIREIREKATRFLNIVARSSIDFKKTKLIVVELSPEKWASVFLKEVKTVANEGFFKQRFSENIVFEDLNKILKKEDYYLLDLHLTKQGNMKVGTYLAKTIKQLQGE